MRWAPTILVSTVAVWTIALAGCGSQSSMNCTPSFTLSAAPATDPVVEPNHTDPPPGNQEQFIAALFPTAAGSGCAVPQVVEKVAANWTVSDPVHVTISSANNATNGVATCIGATSGPATVTASYTQNSVTKTATNSLICK
jgi:hypothetical protein